MNYEEAVKAVEELPLKISPDFYRMWFAESIALGLRDAPEDILHSVVNHGTDAGQAMLQDALTKGYVVQDEKGWHVVDLEDSGAPYYFKSHIAMQIAYPDKYSDYFDGEYVWSFSHPKMQVLVELCISCLVNKLHPSDYYGQHEIPSEEKKMGRPKIAKAKKSKDPEFSAWVDACREYNAQLKKAWSLFHKACADRREAEAKAKEWRDSEHDRLRAEMTKVSKQYGRGMEPYIKAVEEARFEHARLKAKGKPKRV